MDFVIFVAWQYRRGNAALIPLSPLHQRVLYSSCLNMFFIMGNLIVTIYYFPIWFQVVKNSSPIESGVNLLPMIVPQIVFSVLAGGLGRLFPNDACIPDDLKLTDSIF